MIFSRDVLIGVLLALLIAAGVGGINYWKKYKEKKLDELASVLYLYESGKVSKEEAEKKLKGTELYPYFLALGGGSASEIANLLKDKDLKSLYLEREAFTLYSKKEYDRSLSILEKVDKEHFNYPSALLLKAFDLEGKGDRKSALEVYKTLQKDYPETYFGKIASAFLLLRR